MEETKKRYINVEVTEELHWKLLNNAMKKRLGFHDYIRSLYQEVTK